jgi:hypothetical protein
MMVGVLVLSASVSIMKKAKASIAQQLKWNVILKPSDVYLKVT